MATETQRLSEIIAANAPLSLEQIIKLEIDEWKRSEHLKWMQEGRRYYRVDHEIRSRKRMMIGEGGMLQENKNLSNRKLIHSFVRKLVDQKIGYLLSKPISIQTGEKVYAELLADIFDKPFLRTMKNVGKDSISAGIGWLQVYYDENGILSFKRHRPEEIIPLWRDAEHTELDAVIRVYDVEQYVSSKKQTVTKVEFWDLRGVRRYTLNPPGLVSGVSGLVPDEDMPESGHFIVSQGDDDEVQTNWERIPFVPFKYNDDELPLIAALKSLVDEYDLQTSDNANNIADSPNSILVLKDYDGQDLGEFRRNLSQVRAIKVSGERGGVEPLSIDLNTDALEKHLDRIRKDIYEFGRGVDTQAERLGNSPSGEALKFLYQDLDLDANDIENEFQASLEQLLWFVDRHIFNTAGRDYSDEQVDFIFNRDIMINETEAVNNVRNSAGTVSEETLVANHPFVTDVSLELERLRKQRQSELDDPYAGGDEA
ncbi:phage portal protein [Tumebacillus algifaecis]|uniref:Phage portal protein n=1 Tax=Tumebacillus algifaecis TaxID=1214604 RepID=A0A223D5E9_9BACL|nr:phage portal protein [Tumebacillus algifaecis]ASS76829.1 phage portal protein [Tumebacillus algifaecis]